MLPIVYLRAIHIPHIMPGVCSPIYHVLTFDIMENIAQIVSFPYIMLAGFSEKSGVTATEFKWAIYTKVKVRYCCVSSIIK